MSVPLAFSQSESFTDLRIAQEEQRMINAWRKPRICTYSEHLQLSRGGIPAGVREVEDVLKQEGFGVLTEIDLRAALREKLGREFPPVKGARWFD